MTHFLDPGARVLFQGDSITDAGRIRNDPDNLGGGYAMMAAAWFSARYPERGITFVNRGISGNRAVDLQARWQADCLDLRPAWVSIMIGINDTCHRHDSNDPMPLPRYEAAYRDILERTRSETGARLILMEPFLLPVPDEHARWRDDLDPSIDTVRRLAREFDALLVPLDGLFAAAATRRPPAFWAADGVHPTAAGHALIAQAWLKTVGAA